MIPATFHNRVSLRNINNRNYEEEPDAQSQSTPDSDPAVQKEMHKATDFSLPVEKQFLEIRLKSSWTRFVIPVNTIITIQDNLAIHRSVRSFWIL